MTDSGLPAGWERGICKPNAWRAFRERPGKPTVHAEARTLAELAEQCREIAGTNDDA